MALYFETAVRYDKIMQNGTIKKTTEKYLVDALSFAEAEAITTRERTPYISGDFDVRAAKKTKIAEIIGNREADRFFLAKIAFITIDEKSAAEKRSLTHILIGASTFEDAYATLQTEMDSTIADYEITSITETPILEIYPHES